jgi:MFS family permease
VVAARQTWLCTLFGFAMTGAMLAFGGLWAVSFLQAVYGFARPEAAATTSLLFAGWGVGAPAIGWLAGRFPRRRRAMMAGFAAIAALSIAAVTLAPPLPAPLLLALVAAHGAAASSMILCFAAVREASAPEAASTAMAVVNTAVVGSGALLQPLIGALLDLGWDGAVAAGTRVYPPEAWRAALAVLPAACALGVVAALLLRDPPPLARPAAIA